jgi:hypothetical protein
MSGKTVYKLVGRKEEIEERGGTPVFKGSRPHENPCACHLCQVQRGVRSWYESKEVYEKPPVGRVIKTKTEIGFASKEEAEKWASAHFTGLYKVIQPPYAEGWWVYPDWG